ncbi:MAG TPA: DinB family protein [Candidatus Limnocylindria bacterium]|nr:DinB family protein [Candidatus Limnocylindria bacterium]
MTAVLDAFVLERAPGPTVQIHPALARLRTAFNATFGVLATIPDERLTSLWVWDGNAINVRYAFYRTLEMLESTAAEVARGIAGYPSSEARDAVGATSAARWELQGVLAGLSDADLDADPGGGEWTVRQTMGHIIGGQRGYAWGNAYWISVRDQAQPPGPRRAPEGLFASMPQDDEEATGTLVDVRQKLDDIVDTTSSRYATLTADEMDAAAGWYGFPVTVAFRMWRLPSHIEEHTLQIEKTLDMLGHRATEVERLVRLNARAMGRLEALVFGRAADQLDAAQSGATLDRLAQALHDMTTPVKAAADTGEPGPPD